MHAIESTIFERLHNCENVKYAISHSDVINAKSCFWKRTNQASKTHKPSWTRIPHEHVENCS